MNFEANFPSECLEDIFRHSSGKNLLKCTLVCPEWNDFIGSTRSCMTKIKFDISSEKSRKIILTDSKRKYECLNVRGGYHDELQEILSMKGKKWTHISSTKWFSNTVTDFLNFLRTFQTSVEELVLHSVSVNNGSFDSSDLQFP